jgi:hypothetical protein
MWTVALARLGKDCRGAAEARSGGRLRPTIVEALQIHSIFVEYAFTGLRLIPVQAL